MSDRVSVFCWLGHFCVVQVIKDVLLTTIFVTWLNIARHVRILFIIIYNALLIIKMVLKVGVHYQRLAVGKLYLKVILFTGTVLLKSERKR